MKILAVDDDELILELLVLALADAGYHDVITLNSPTSALDLIAALDPEADDQDRGRFDCFLLDIQMPEMDGIELCKLIRANPAYRSTPILMITSMADRSFIDRAFAAGATDYITKPFDQIELGTRVKLARTLVTEQRKALQAYFLASAMNTGLEDEKRAIFEAPITIEGVPKVVDYLVLENYLLQLSRQGVHETIAIAFKFAEAEQTFKDLSEEEFFKVLEGFAKAVTQKFGDSEFLLSYFGSGFFVCVTEKANSVFSKPTEDGLSNFSIGIDLGESFGISKATIAVGDPIRNPISHSNDVHTMLVQSIVSAAENSTNSDNTPRAVKKLRATAMKYNVFSAD